MNEATQSMKRSRILALAALVCGVLSLLSSLVWIVKIYFSVYSIFVMLEPIAVAALLLRYALRPRRGTYRAAAIALIVIYGAQPLIHEGVQIVMKLMAGSDWHFVVKTRMLDNIVNLTMANLTGYILAVLGILLMLERQGAVRVVALITIALAVGSLFQTGSLLLNPLYREQMGMGIVAFTMVSSFASVLCRVFSLLVVYGMKASPPVRSEVISQGLRP